MQALCETIAAQLNHYPQVLVAYLFGSQARGQAGLLSDIDVAVLLDANVSQAEAFELQLQLATTSSPPLAGRAQTAMLMSWTH